MTFGLWLGIFSAAFFSVAANQVQAQPAKAPPGSGYEDLRKEANKNLFTIITSGLNTGYAKFGADIADTLNGLPNAEIRVVAMLGEGGGQNVLDMYLMRGVDGGIVTPEDIKWLQRKYPTQYGNLNQRINYIVKLFDFKLHIFAKKDITSLEQLRGQKISCLKQLSTIHIFCENLFGALGIPVEIVHDADAVAMQKVKSGEIAAAARGALPPLPGFENVKPEDNLHFVPIDAAHLANSPFDKIKGDYLPARLRSSEYPTMIPEGQDVPTLATASVLGVYGWPSASDRYRSVENFVRLFFDNIEKFGGPPRHPGWKNINLAADVPGMIRFPAAQKWLDQKRQSMTSATASVSPKDDDVKKAFVVFLDMYVRAKGGGQISETEKAEMWRQFKEWSAKALAAQ
jgi:TRAP-type uncharacterized transport system substrate-binding protein